MSRQFGSTTHVIINYLSSYHSLIAKLLITFSITLIMIIIFFLFLLDLISAKFSVNKTTIPPQLEVINKSFVYVDYSKSFIIEDFSEVISVHLRNDRGLDSKANRTITTIEIDKKEHIIY